MSRIIDIKDTTSLLTEFLQTFRPEEVEAYSVNVLPIRSRGAEVRVKSQGAQATLPVWPRLYPSRKLLTEAADNRQQVLLCPHLPDELATDLRQQGIHHADLNGRLYLQTPWLVLDRRPVGSRYRNPSSTVDVFSLKSSRIPRALLAQREKQWTQEELAERTMISRGLVSRILKTLQEEGWVTQVTKASRTQSARYVLSDFDRLLDAWRKADRWTDRVTLQQFSVLSSDLDEIARKVTDLAGSDETAFTQWYAAHLRQPYTTPPLVSAYVIYQRHLDLPLGRKVNSGGNLWLMYPHDDGLFLETQWVGGRQLVTDAQIFLDLIEMGQRGPDQAEALRHWEGFAR